MDLERARALANTYNSLEGEEKEEAKNDAKFAREALSREFPALSETDHAAIALFIAGMLSTINGLPLQRAANVARDSSTAYALACVELLGWDS